jgi:anti-anti-sigma regulatory factor
MPNLLAWAERLPGSADVIVLDLEQVNQIDANSVLELRAVLGRMRAQNRHLILAGLSHEQVEQLRRAGTGEALDPRDVCPDLELAIAKGLNLLDGHR